MLTILTLLIIANKVSINGTAKITIGKNKEINVIFLKPSKDKKPIINPIINAPLSPRKIVAGWKLKNKKPSNAPINKLQIIMINTFPCNIAMKPMVVKPIAAHDAKPSKPSIKFIAFVIATIHIIVIGILKIPK